MAGTVRVFFKTHNGDEIPVDAEVGCSLMMAAVINNVPGIEGQCGGSLICATCHVYADRACQAAAGPASEEEDEMLEATAAERRPNSRLSCQIEISAALEGARIEIPESQ